MSTLIRAGMAAWRVFEEPALAHQEQIQLGQQSMYHMLWSYYNGSMFERVAGILNAGYQNRWESARGWSAYKANYNLYRNIRLIYNPTRRLVDFYAGQVYPGVLSEDGKSLPDGVSLAVPFSEDTTPELKKAIAQFWHWSNWQARKSVQVRYGAALGNALIEVVDDLERGQVSAEIIWPGFVSGLELDPAGNVQSYTLTYDVQHDMHVYRYAKTVDKEAFRYFKNDEPFDYGDGAIVPNPYGFVPAVWIKHIDIGGMYGSPAIAGALGKIDELNNIASHVHDQIHKVIGAPLVLWSSGAIANLFATQNRGASAEFIEPAADQESLLMLKGPADGKVDSLAGNLSLSDAALYMDRLIGEIEHDHPELTFYQELRSMSQVTGPAAARLVGDVNSRFAEVSAGYDQANIRLFQMATAIGGFRANSGAWGVLNRQQQKFLPFDLMSYERGDLDLAIMPRPLLNPTRMEIGQENEQMWRGVYYAGQAGVPPEFVLQEAGWTEDKLAQLGQAQVTKIKQDQFLGQQDVIPTTNQ